ncbi:hypothetical protein GBAR_LOCUS22793, partial [Geodia barretti]
MMRFSLLEFFFDSFSPRTTTVTARAMIKAPKTTVTANKTFSR